jgi:hypothetical protein
MATEAFRVPNTTHATQISSMTNLSIATGTNPVTGWKKERKRLKHASAIVLRWRRRRLHVQTLLNSSGELFVVF